MEIVYMSLSFFILTLLHINETNATVNNRFCSRGQIY